MSDSDINELRRTVQELSERVTRLESLAGQPRAYPIQPLPARAARPSLESKLGSQYLNRAGIIALLVGVSYFLHLAFTNNWIGPEVRVGVGLGGGLAVVALGQLFERRRYTAFGLSLKALGIGALYLSVWAGFQLYQLISMPATAAGMIIITAAAVAMSWRQQSEGLAAVAFAGGFATPILVSNGGDLYGVLFAYVVLLCVAVLVLLRRFAWRKLLLVAYCGCVVITSAWYAEFFTPSLQISFAFYSTVLLIIFAVGAARAAAKSQSGIALTVGMGSCLGYLIAITAALRTDAAAVIACIGLSLVALTWKLPTRLAPVSFFVGLAYCAYAVPVALDTRWTTSAIWLAIGAVAMTIGFAKQLAFVRWAALWLIGITVLKVFFYDLSRLEQGYRVLAATVLGIALLAISFVYQRYRLRQE